MQKWKPNGETRKEGDHYREQLSSDDDGQDDGSFVDGQTWWDKNGENLKTIPSINLLSVLRRFFFVLLINSCKIYQL